MKKQTDSKQKNSNSFSANVTSLSFALIAVVLSACAGSGGGTGTGNPDVEDSSTSGVVASAIGGAMSNSATSGSLAFNSSHKKSSFSFIPSAYASTACPTYLTASGSGCRTSGSSMWLTYADCSFGNSEASWDAVQAFIMSAGTASCGTFPNPGANETLTLQYETLITHAPSTALLTTDFGTLSTIDDASSNLNNFNGDLIPAILNGGYGAQVGYNSSGKKNSLTLDHRLTVDRILDHSITGMLGISETSSTSRNVTGQVTIYHNLLQIVGTAVLSNVVHENGCCLPVSGSITTTFAAGSNTSKPPTALGELMVGKSETLTFTGCRTGTLQTYDGTTENVSLSRCF
jgi:hypothetical protein